MQWQLGKLGHQLSRVPCVQRAALPSMWIEVSNGSQHLRRGEDRLTDKNVPDHVGTDRQAQLDETWCTPETATSANRAAVA